MAHLEVQPKRSKPWWIWAIIILLLVLLAAMLLRKCDAEHSDALRAANADSTTNVVAATGPDWNSIDFNTAPSSDADITDAEIEARAGQTYTIYSLGENILFTSGNNDISTAGQTKLKMISDVLKKRFEGATIGVFGSADATGPADENKELGAERAGAVRNWLVSGGGVPEATISVRSLGEEKPVATNETSAGRKQNRNVSIVVFPKQ
ncbi:MAG: OmpA family protein [Bacteroidota bacterium]